MSDINIFYTQVTSKRTKLSNNCAHLRSTKESWIWKKEYVVVLGQYRAVLFGTWWYWVSITWYCLLLSGTGLFYGFNASIYWKKWRWSDVTIAGRTDKQTRKDRATQPIDYGRLRWAKNSQKLAWTTFYLYVSFVRTSTDWSKESRFKVLKNSPG